MGRVCTVNANLRDKWVPVKIQKENKRKWINRTVVKARRAKAKAWIKYKCEKMKKI